MSKGRFFNENEDNSLAKVAVLGSGLAEEFFGQDDPLGKKVKLKGQNIKVIGVLEPQGMFSSVGGIDMNDFVYLPLQTALKEMLGIDYLSEIVLAVEGEEYFLQAEEEIARMLRRNHNITDPDKDDFMITTMVEILEQINEISVILNLLLNMICLLNG